MRHSLCKWVFVVVLFGALATVAVILGIQPATPPLSVWLTGAAFSVLTASTSMLIARRQLAGATDTLATFAKRVGSGDLEAKVDDSLPADLAGLGQALNSMKAKLHSTLGTSWAVQESLLESSPCLVLDAAGRISRISPAFLGLLDSDVDESACQGRTPEELFPGALDIFTAPIEALREGRPVERETLLTTKGNPRFLRLSAAPLRANGGPAIGSLTVSFDLTPTKEKEQSLDRYIRSTEKVVGDSLEISAEVSEASEALSELITNANAEARLLMEHAGESATAMEQMNATVLEVARNSVDAATMARDASDKASGGAQTVENLVHQIEGVDGAIGELMSRVHKLDSQASDIGRIIYVINDIADQTNLLALNAAIEAARAGDAGRGFAVVADEVRKLAEKTMSATGEVGAVITAIQDSVKSAASEMQDASKAIDEVTERAKLSGAALAEIRDLSEQTSQQIHSIAAAAEQQSAAVSQINRAVEETNTVAHHTNASMNKAALSILSLSGRASDLKRIMESMDCDSGEVQELSTSGGKLPCWEHMKCGREKGGARVSEMGVCPAWPDHGEKCAVVEGTFCGGKVQGDYASKIAHCAKCNYFKSGHHDRNLEIKKLDGRDLAGRKALSHTHRRV